MKYHNFSKTINLNLENTAMVLNIKTEISRSVENNTINVENNTRKNKLKEYLKIIKYN